MSDADGGVVEAVDVDNNDVGEGKVESKKVQDNAKKENSDPVVNETREGEAGDEEEREGDEGWQVPLGTWMFRASLRS